MIRAKQLLVEQSDQVVPALRVYTTSSADLPDCLIERVAEAAGCETVMTFDAGASWHDPGQVTNPLGSWLFAGGRFLRGALQGALGKSDFCSE